MQTMTLESPSELLIARGISVIEDFQITPDELAASLATGLNSEAFVIGITGSPGVGKSSFLNMLLGQFGNQAKKIAVIAIDPSSHLNGGAILGDRIRMSDSNLGVDTYFRSLAARGAYGGLTSVTSTVVLFLSQCRFNTIIIETVGVGQNEVDISKIANVVIHVMDSTSGDDIQLEKSGIMEIGDIYFVNKVDIFDASKFVFNLKSSLQGQSRKSHISPIVISGSAKNGFGVSEVVDSLKKHSDNHSARVAGRGNV
jgi:LAO/AO transport system kinase